MAETENGLLQAFEIGWACEECGGQMSRSDRPSWTNPPHFPHECENGHTANLTDTYPKVVFRRLSPETA